MIWYCVRKVIVIAICTLILLAGVVVGGQGGQGRQLAAQSRDNRLRVAVVFSEQYYSSYSGRTIRAALRRQRRNIAKNERGRHPFYRFVKLNGQREQLDTVIQQLIINDTEAIISFEQQLTEQLLRIAPAFPAQRFYLFDGRGNSSDPNDNVHLISLEVNAYNYLLGYFTSLLLHYRFTNQPQAETAVITIGDTANTEEVRAVTLGLRSVAVQHGYQYETISNKLTREQIFNLFDKLKLDGIEAVILLSSTIAPRPFFRAAAQNDIALITQASRRYLRGAHVAQREVHWQAIISAYLIPHIRHQRDRDITVPANDTYYSIRHRARIIDAGTAELVSTQLNKIINKITRQKVNLQL